MKKCKNLSLHDDEDDERKGALLSFPFVSANKRQKKLQRAIQFDYLRHKYRKRQSIEAPQQQRQRQ